MKEVVLPGLGEPLWSQESPFADGTDIGLSERCRQSPWLPDNF